MFILLNGTSSSGKTSIAHALRELLADPTLIFSRDQFHQSLPDQFWEEAALRRAIGPTVFRQFHQSLLPFCTDGQNVIIDHILNQAEWPLEIATVFEGIDLYFIGVKCPMKITEDRERSRDDRPNGLARSQIDIVHAHGDYDFSVDTSRLPPSECAMAIIDHVENNVPYAFRRRLAQPTRHN